MVRFDRILEIIEANDLVGNAARLHTPLMTRLRQLETRYEGVTDARGMGLMCAFDLPDSATRNAVVKAAFDEGAMMLGSGPATIRFRPSLTVTEADLTGGLDILDNALATVLEA